MASNVASKYRDNFGKWQNKVTINLKKKLLQEAETLRTDLEQATADKLKEVHIANVIASYYPRARGEQEKVEYNKAKKAEEAEKNKGKYGEDRKRLSRKKLSYQHTGTLENSIDTRIERRGKYESRVSVIIKPIVYPQDHPRKDGKHVTAVDVYRWLREGTNVNKQYWFQNGNGERPSAYNYPTPAHPFEIHTTLQMKGWLDNLNIKTLARKKKYRKG